MNNIILTSYNRTKLLAQAIESALSQTVKDITLYIIDDGSPSATQKIIEGYAARDNRIIYFQTNKKDEDRYKCCDYSANINFCLKKIKEGNVFYLVCDDYYAPTHVELLSQALKAHPEWKVVYGTQMVLRYDDITEKDTISFIRRHGPMVERAACQIDHIQVAHRIELIDEVGYWPEEACHYGACDAAFWTNINIKYPFYKATDEITNYNRHHKDSIQGL